VGWKLNQQAVRTHERRQGGYEMRKLAWCLAVFALVGVLLALAPAPAAAQHPEVSTLRPWSAETNYMSLPGYLRWLVFREDGVWLSMAEARRIVSQQQVR